MSGWIRLLVISGGVLVLSWTVLVILAARLPPGVLRELDGFLPNCVKTARTLRGDPSVPRRAKVAVGFAALWCLSPIDLIPEFVPVIGPLDDSTKTTLVARLGLTDRCGEPRCARVRPPDVIWTGGP